MNQVFARLMKNVLACFILLTVIWSLKPKSYQSIPFILQRKETYMRIALFSFGRVRFFRSVSFVAMTMLLLFPVTRVLF